MSCLVQNIEYMIEFSQSTARGHTALEITIYKPHYLDTEEYIHENLDSSALIDPSLCKLR